MKISALVIVVAMQVTFVACEPANCIARNSETSGCMFGRQRIPKGQAVSMQDPCVQASCSGDGTTLTVRGCPFEGGRNPHPGAPGSPTPGLQFPFCCDRCSPVQ